MDAKGRRSHDSVITPADNSHNRKDQGRGLRLTLADAREDQLSDNQRMRTAIGFILLLAAAALCAQQIPSGTILPCMLDNTLDSSRNKPGEQISAKLRQDVPLPNGQKIKRNSKVSGHVVAVSGGNPASITVQFDHVSVGKSSALITVGLRALASMEAVSEARQPANPNSGYGTTSWDWNMLLIGGQAAFNGQRVVKSQDGRVVGKVVEPGAILGVPMANPERGCAGAPPDSSEQAFWLFSTDACGTYGYKDLTISGNSSAAGQVVLQSPQKIVVRSGSGLLLQTK
jgi:hypothetical protein